MCFTHESESVYVTYKLNNFNCHIETAWIFKVTAMHVQCKSGSIRETWKIERDLVVTDH